MDELQSVDPKVIKKVEKNIDFLLACMAVKPEKKDKDKKDKDKKDQKDKKENEKVDDIELGGNSPRLADTTQMESSHKLKDRLAQQEAGEIVSSGLDMSSKLEQDFNATMQDINSHLENNGLRHRKGGSYDDEAKENDLQKLTKRWSYMSTH